MKEVFKLAYYRFILFHESDPYIEGNNVINLENVSVDGFIIDDKILLRDTLRWMIPEADEDQLQRIFVKMLKRTADEAKQKQYVTSLISKHF